MEENKAVVLVFLLHGMVREGLTDKVMLEACRSPGGAPLEGAWEAVDSKCRDSEAGGCLMWGGASEVRGD